MLKIMIINLIVFAHAQSKLSENDCSCFCKMHNVEKRSFAFRNEIMIFIVKPLEKILDDFGKLSSDSQSVISNLNNVMKSYSMPDIKNNYDQAITKINIVNKHTDKLVEQYTYLSNEISLMIGLTKNLNTDDSYNNINVIKSALLLTFQEINEYQSTKLGDDIINDVIKSTTSVIESEKRIDWSSRHIHMYKSIEEYQLIIKEKLLDVSIRFEKMLQATNRMTNDVNEVMNNNI